MAPMHRQCDILLGPLERLGILSMGACHLQAWRMRAGCALLVVGGRRVLPHALPSSTACPPSLAHPTDRPPTQAFPPELAAHTALRALYLGECEARDGALSRLVNGWAACWLVGWLHCTPIPFAPHTPHTHSH